MVGVLVHLSLEDVKCLRFILKIILIEVVDLQTPLATAIDLISILILNYYSHKKVCLVKWCYLQK